MIRQIAATLFSLGVALTAQGQSSDELTRTTFRVFPILAAEWEGIFYQPEPKAEMQKLVFRPRNRSFDRYDYVGPQKLSFYREDGLDEDGEMSYRIVGQVPVSEPDLLVFFTKNKSSTEGSLEFSTLAIDDSPQGLPPDYVTFINFTPVSFACRFMDKDMMLRPGANKAISVKEKLEEDVFIGLAITNQKTHRVVMKNQWRFYPGNRHLILLLPPRSQNSFRIRAYRISEFVGENQRFNPNWTPPEIIEETSPPQF